MPLPSQSLHELCWRWCSQMLLPSHSLHRWRWRWCSQMPLPPQSLHLLRWRWCSQTFRFRLAGLERIGADSPSPMCLGGGGASVAGAPGPAAPAMGKQVGLDQGGKTGKGSLSLDTCSFSSSVLGAVAVVPRRGRTVALLANSHGPRPSLLISRIRRCVGRVEEDTATARVPESVHKASAVNTARDKRHIAWMGQHEGQLNDHSVQCVLRLKASLSY